jgi:hypothetical protein
MIRMQLESTITCPHCGHRSLEVMPQDACQFFYDCKGCDERLTPKARDCCVFYSYGLCRAHPSKRNESGVSSAGSITETMIVMLSLPFALVGGLWLMWWLGFNLSVAVVVGFIALAGVAAETGVVMLI